MLRVLFGTLLPVQAVAFRAGGTTLTRSCACAEPRPSLHVTRSHHRRYNGKPPLLFTAFFAYQFRHCPLLSRLNLAFFRRCRARSRLFVAVNRLGDAVTLSISPNENTSCLVISRRSHLRECHTWSHTPTALTRWPTTLRNLAPPAYFDPTHQGWRNLSEVRVA